MDDRPPIQARLASPHTVLRSLCDPSMVVQAIIDAIVDLAFPVLRAYQDSFGELELSVLTDPDISHTSMLYILTSELSLLRNTLHPIIGLISQLKVHRKVTGIEGMEISSVARTYFGDVEDHCKPILPFPVLGTLGNY
jgi:Mg2+ and Co2+ transporter CorA